MEKIDENMHVSALSFTWKTIGIKKRRHMKTSMFSYLHATLNFP